MNKLLSTEKRKEIKEQANVVLREHAMQGDTKSLLLHIAKNSGIDVREADMFELSGALRKEDGAWRIYINKQDSSTRQLFTLAHELGHFFLHKDRRSEFVDGGFVMHRQEAHRYEEDEVEANEFAGNLLMPEGIIRQRIGDERNVRAEQVLSLAQEFRVSPIAMVTRLRNIGYEPPDRPTQ